VLNACGPHIAYAKVLVLARCKQRGETVDGIGHLRPSANLKMSAKHSQTRLPQAFPLRAKARHTAVSIPAWSPTTVVIRQYRTYVCQGYRSSYMRRHTEAYGLRNLPRTGSILCNNMDAQFSRSYGSMCCDVLANSLYPHRTCPWPVLQSSRQLKKSCRTGPEVLEQEVSAQCRWLRSRFDTGARSRVQALCRQSEPDLVQQLSR
jgi:hypothetical protein